MTTNTTTIQAAEEYRRQIRDWAGSLAVATLDCVDGHVLGNEPLERVKMFADGNLEKRFNKVKNALDLLDEVYDELEDHIVEYVKTVPLAAYDNGTGDAERFLAWLKQRVTLDPEQLDVCACHQARFDVENVAWSNRFGHVRFQELWSRAVQFSLEWGVREELWIHPNPIHAPAVFHTNVLLDEDDETPAEVMFFPVGDDVRTAVLEPSGRQVFDTLAQGGPHRFDELDAALFDVNREELIEIGRDLAETGLAAFG